MKTYFKIFSCIGVSLLVSGTILGFLLTEQAETYSKELEAAYIAYFVFGIALLFFFLALIASVKNKSKLLNLAFSLISLGIIAASIPFLFTPGLPRVLYTYESSDRGFAMYEHKGGKGIEDKSISFDDIKRAFEQYKNSHKENSEIHLCRTFAKDVQIKWYHFYIWLEYKLDKRWKLPYITPSDSSLKNRKSEVICGSNSPAAPKKNGNVSGKN